MKKYRPKWGYSLLSGLVVIAALATSASIVAGLVAFFLVISGVMLVDFSLDGWQTEGLVSLGKTLGGLCAIMGPFAGFVVLMVFVGMIVTLGRSLFSYLEVGPTGLEWRNWPIGRLRCDWDQVIEVEQINIIGISVLRIKEDVVKSWPGFGYHFWYRRNWNLIPLYLFKGWPNGELRQNLEDKIGPISFDQ